MNCSSCQKEVLPDSYFCNWCSDFVPSPGQGEKAGLIRRVVAQFAEIIIGVLVWFGAFAIFAAIFGVNRPGPAIACTSLCVLAYVIYWLWLFQQGMTPGKKCMSLQVVKCQTGQNPGFVKMLLRETVGRAVSGAFLGIGYFWAIFDKNGQAWHDKLVGTVVIKRGSKANMPREFEATSPT